MFSLRDQKPRTVIPSIRMRTLEDAADQLDRARADIRDAIAGHSNAFKLHDEYISSLWAHIRQLTARVTALEGRNAVATAAGEATGAREGSGRSVIAPDANAAVRGPYTVAPNGKDQPEGDDA